MQMVTAPVICGKCGHASIEPIPFGGPLNHARFINVQISINGSCCPKCGGPWLMPDGEYTGDTITFFRADQFEMVRNAFQRLREMAEQGASAEEISETIDREYPFAENLKPFLREGLKAFGPLCVLLSTLMGRCSPDQPAPSIETNNVEIHVNGDVNGVLSGISEKLGNDPANTPTETEKPTSPRSPK